MAGNQAVKYQHYANIADQQTRQVTGSMQDWTGFLSTAGRLYKYPFEEQLMIHAQKPDAIACAPIEIWNKPMHRYVKRGSKGIALLDNTGSRPRLKYVFDVMDTQDGRYNPRRPFLWEFKPEHDTAVREAILNNYDITDLRGNPLIDRNSDMSDMLFGLAQSLSARYYEDNRRDIAYAVEGSFLDGYDEFNISVAYRDALTVSTAYTLLTRCGLDPADYIENEDFQPIFDFNTPESVVALGKGVSEISEEVLREIEVTIKNYERQKAVEMEGNEHGGRNNDSRQQRDNVLPFGGLSDTQHNNTRANGIVGEIRHDEEGLSEQAQGDSVLDIHNEGNAVHSLSGNREAGQQTVDEDNEAVGITGAAAEQDSRPDGPEVTHGQAESPSGADGNRGTDLQLDEAAPPSETQSQNAIEFNGEAETPPMQFSLFDLPTEQQQLDIINGTEHSQAQTAQEPTFLAPPKSATITQEDIDHAITIWNDDIESKIRVFEYMQENARARSTADFLRREYLPGGWTDNPAVPKTSKSQHGLHIFKDGIDEPVTLPWAKVQQRIGQLMNEGKFLTADERMADNAVEAEAELPTPTIEEQIREVLSQRGIVVSDELIADGIEDYNWATRNFYDIADFIQAEYLTEEPELEAVTATAIEQDKEDAAEATQLREAVPGDELYIRNKLYIIDTISPYDVRLYDPSLNADNPYMPPIKMSIFYREFDEAISNDTRNAHLQPLEPIVQVSQEQQAPAQQSQQSQEEHAAETTDTADNADILVSTAYERHLTAKEQYPKHFIFTSLGVGNDAELYGENAEFIADVMDYPKTERTIDGEVVNMTSVPDSDIDGIIEQLNIAGMDAVFINSYGAMAVYSAKDYALSMQQSEHTQPIQQTEDELPIAAQAELQGNPLWQSYQSFAAEHTDKIAFVQVGDFYEVMGSDAVAVARFLNIGQTSRDVGLPERIPMCGIPNFTLDDYTDILIKNGFGVAIRNDDGTVDIREAARPEHENAEIYYTPEKRIPYQKGDIFGQLSTKAVIEQIDDVYISYNYVVNPLSVPTQMLRERFEELLDSGTNTIQTPTRVAALEQSQEVMESAEAKEPSGDIAQSPTTAIADYVKSKLEAGEKITSTELFAEAAKAYGDTMANNAFTSKDAYDAMELGVNQYMLAMDNTSHENALENVMAALDLLPSQTRRTAEMERFQQFSTPPSIAYLANWAANVNANDVVLEPSAGIGGIAVFAKKDGAQVYVNELDKRRLEIIKNLPFDGFYNEDAEQINNIHGDKLEPTVIVMNPPFSSSAERNIHNTKIGAKHIDEALKMLAPNGRLVAIVGQGMADDAPAFRSWWRDIKEQYNVKANIGVDGKNYNKYGTTFGIQLLVIDKTGPTTEPVKTAFVENLTDLQTILGGIRNERPNIEIDSGTERNTATEARSETVTEREPEHKPNDPVSDTNGRTDTAVSGVGREQTITPEIDTVFGRTPATAPDPASVGNDGIAPNVYGGRDRGNDERNDVNEVIGRTGDSDSGQSVGSVEQRVRPPKPVKTELTDSIFEQYEPQPLLLQNVQPHPANISESAAMSAIQPPTVTYKPNLSQDLIDKGVLSDVQLEAVTYAGQSHSQTLPNGTTRGFFLGDGTGVGKGRTVTGIILDNFNQGSKKALWLSENTGLVPDAKRDVKALFGNSDLVTEFKGGKSADKSLSNDEAILFATYSSLSKGFDQSGSNFEKIVNWLGKDFDGVIVFDEAHNMANSIATKGSRGIKKASQRGMAGLAIQEALPNAKIIYSSATGATEVENLRYADRLGLWGEGTAFPNGDVFVSRIKAGGLAAMELIARDMKAMGVYLSRNISYEDVVYDKIVHELTPGQRTIYDELARSWQIVLQNLNKALQTTNQDKDGMAKGKAYGAFWSSEQRFFNQILTAMQVPSMIADMQKQLDNDNSIVIQLVSTNEAAQEREFARLQEQDLELEDFDLTPKQMLMSYIENSFPTHQFEKYEDDNGNIRSRPVYDSEGNQVINREAVRQKEELLDKLGSIKVPSSALDMIINHFGSDMVAENTGRKRRVVVTDGVANEENIAHKKQADVSAFQDGDKRIIVFSKAGGTGKSYHADKSAKNQQHRVHYLLQAGWQADAAVQGFGRSHRSNQVSSPTFALVTTDLKGQMRFISTIAKRLDQLGALTKGQRQTGSQGLFTAGDNLENAFAADVLAVYYKELMQNGVKGIPNGMAVIEKLGLKDKLVDEYGNFKHAAQEFREVNKFLNRILSLECHEQNAVFEGYAKRLHHATEMAMQEGKLDKGLENYWADKVVLNDTHDVRVDEATGATTKYYSLTAYNKIEPLQFNEVDTQTLSFMGYYQSKNTGAVRAVFQTSSSTDEHGNVTENCRLTGQDGREYMPLSRLMYNWTQLTPEKAETLWNNAIEQLPEFRESNLHLIGGTVLPVWDKLPVENVRIYRVLTEDGDMLIGRVIPEDRIDATLDKLGAVREKPKLETEDLIKLIKNGDTVHIDNDWRIVQRRVSNEQRIEVIGPSYLHNDLLTKKGLFTERIAYQTRYFIPAKKDTAKILDDITKLYPVIRVAKSNGRNMPRSDERTSVRSDGQMAAKTQIAKEKPSMLEAIERYAEKSRAEFGNMPTTAKTKEAAI